MLNQLIHWSGVIALILVGLFILLVLFQSFIHPAMESVSLVRFLFRWHLGHKTSPVLHLCKAIPGGLWHYFLDQRRAFGRTSYTMSDGSKWEGIGNWELRPVEDKPPCPLP